MATEIDVKSLALEELKTFDYEQIAGVILTICQNSSPNHLWMHMQPNARLNILSIFTTIWNGANWEGIDVSQSGATVHSPDPYDLNLEALRNIIDQALELLKDNRLIEPDDYQAGDFFRLTAKGRSCRVDSNAFNLLDINRPITQLAEIYESSVYMVSIIKKETKDHQMGTAFKVGNSVLLSCKHNFENIESYELRNFDGKVWADKNLKITRHPDTGIDLAIIELINGNDHFSGNTIQFGQKAKLGSPCLLMGYPNIPGAEPSLTIKELKVSSITPEYLESKQKRIFFSEDIQGGFSGSPILDTTGRLIGLLIGSTGNSETTSDNGKSVNNFGKAIPIDEIKSWFSNQT
jgi:V8-like Glu-specific endopeptidase